MADPHHHVHHHVDPEGGGGDDAPVRLRRLLAVTVAVAFVAAVAGMLLMRPSDGVEPLGEEIGFPVELVDGTVRSVWSGPCPDQPAGADLRCNRIEVRLTEGPDAGEIVRLDNVEDASAVQFSVGDRIVLGRTEAPPGAPGSDYYFADFQRRTPLLALAALFVLAVVGLGRLHGVRALLGLGFTMVVLVWFVLPAILEGRSPVAVAVVGSAVVMVVALYLAHGVNVRTSSAILGTLASLALTGVLALVFVDLTQLTGLASEEATFLRVTAGDVNLQGLLLGGIIIGALGVLDDVTVTQASAVWELHRANPALGFSALYRAAVRIGRDHIASTVNTLVLAYAGASLPLLVLLTQAQRPLGDVLTGEIMAVEIVRTLVGSVGLVASVPITTALTTLVVLGDRPRLARFRRPAAEEEWREAAGA